MKINYLLLVSASFSIEISCKSASPCRVGSCGVGLSLLSVSVPGSFFTLTLKVQYMTNNLISLKSEYQILFKIKNPVVTCID